MKKKSSFALAEHDLIISIKKVSKKKKLKKKIISIPLNYDSFLNMAPSIHFVPGREKIYLSYVNDMHKFMIKKLEERPYFVQELVELMGDRNSSWVDAYGFIYAKAKEENSSWADDEDNKYVVAVNNLFEGIEVRAIGGFACLGLAKKLDSG